MVVVITAATAAYSAIQCSTRADGAIVCGGGGSGIAVDWNHSVTVVTTNTATAATQVNRVGLMIVTVSNAADATTTNYDIVVVVLKASVVVDYYAMITACATTVGGAADCTTVLIGVAGRSYNVMLLLLLSQVLLQDKLMISFQRNRREHHAGADGR